MPAVVLTVSSQVWIAVWSAFCSEAVDSYPPAAVDACPSTRCVGTKKMFVVSSL